MTTFEITKIGFIRIAIGCLLLTSMHQQTLAAINPPNSPEVQRSPSPSDLFALVPASVDAAVVFNNPAEQFFASPSGKAVHQLISLTGLFSKTQSAFGSLSSAFEDDTGQTVKAIFSNRVLIAWDGLEIQNDTGSFQSITKAMDAQWTMLCEVNQDSIRRIRKHFQPKPRSIEQGYTLWAIEQGRYELVIFDQDNRPESILIFAPKKSKPLLDEMLSAFDHKKTKHKQLNCRNHLPTLLDSSAPLESTLETMHPNTPWFAAWVVQFGQLASGQNPESNQSIAGTVSIDQGELNLDFTSDAPIDLPKADAPVGLLGAVGDDAIFAMASAQTPTISILDDHMSMSFKASSLINTQNSDDETGKQYIGGPGILVISSSLPGSTQTKANPKSSSTPQTVFTIMAGVDQIVSDEMSLAQSVDALVGDVFLSPSTENFPTYQGRFPNAIRTHLITNEQEKKKNANPPGWPGDKPIVSWISHKNSTGQSLIASIGPTGSDTAAHVDWIANASTQLDAIAFSTTPASPSGVLARGYYYPARAKDLLGQTSLLDSVISNFIERIEWNITRAPKGIYGHATVTFKGNHSKSQLGQ